MFISLTSQYFWTNHSKLKMKFYGLSESRVKRVIKNPLRIEEGIAPETIAVMQPASYKVKNGKKTWSQEIWVMYQLKKLKNNQNQKEKKSKQVQFKIISAWRYPGKTKPGDNLPQEIIEEINEALNNPL